MEKQFLPVHIEHVETLLGGRFREIDERKDILLPSGNLVITGDGLAERLPIDNALELHVVIQGGTQG